MDQQLPEFAVNRPGQMLIPFTQDLAAVGASDPKLYVQPGGANQDEREITDGVAGSQLVCPAPTDAKAILWIFDDTVLDVAGEWRVNPSLVIAGQRYEPRPCARFSVTGHAA